MKKKNKIWLQSLVIAGFIYVFNSGCNNGDGIIENIDNLIGMRAFTTVERTIIPVAVSSNSPSIKPYEISKFSEYGYGVWSYGAGLGYDTRLDLMPTNYNKTSVTNSAKLLNFFAMTDIHITDEESPTQGIYFGIREKGIISGYSPAMLYSTQMLDALIQTVNSLNQVDRFDFGISLGDITNNAQYNELRWFIDVLDGKNINPDSGIKDDPIPGLNNDYQDEFKAAGLDRTIPWYAAIGNHDHFWMGTNPPTEYIRQSYTGSEILQVGDIFTVGGINRKDFYVGVVDGKTLYGNIIGAGPVESTTPQKISSDPNRRFLSRSELMNEFNNSSSNPRGHGFNQMNELGCYTFEPNSNVPIKIIVLDNTQSNSDADVHGYGHGTLDQKRYDWLINELDKGQNEGKLMIIAAHIPIGVKMEGILGAFIGWSTQAAVSEENLIAKLHTYPNLLMWIAGHRHLNTVTALPSPDIINQPELGFWVVETSSLREYPQQFRTFEILRNSDNTVSIVATNVDPSVKDRSFAAKSLSYAIAATQIFKMQYNLLPTGSLSYNVELVKQLTPAMQKKIENLGIPINK
ncbi:MAG: TIGR03768 family metallophosphoesterase [Melioribacteraceae bacterium]